MVEVSGRKNHPKLLAQLQQHAQEGYRIGAPGDSNSNAVARHEQPLLQDVFADPLNHSFNVTCFAGEPPQLVQSCYTFCP